MSDYVVLPKNHLIIIFLVFIGMAVWYIHWDKKKHIDDPEYKYNDSMIKSLTKTIIKNLNEAKQPVQIKQIIDDDLDRRLFLDRRDRDTVYNDFAPPERRQPEHAYPMRLVKNQLNIPTRGLPDSYQMVGVLLRDKTESAFNLFGRQKYPGSDQWEYYVQGSLKNADVKLPITVRGDKEIEDGQIIPVPGTDPTKGGFKVKLYNFDAPRYNPYL